uniref:Uncharacterized protein n=1 Tax=Steinernema glaseri TaxID=37863 RepID=A0A1I8A8B5_9BILA
MTLHAKEDEDGVEGVRVDLVKVVLDSLVEITTQKDAKADELSLLREEEEEEEEEDKLPEDPRQQLLTFEKQFQ